MKKKMKWMLPLWAIGFLFLTIDPAWAHPPTEIRLAYAVDKKKLHIEIEHVSHNLLTHHIRKITIFRNEQQVKNFTLPSQTHPSQVIRDVDLEAKAGDTIQVQAICSEGGRKEATLIIPEEK